MPVPTLTPTLTPWQAARQAAVAHLASTIPWFEVENSSQFIVDPQGRRWANSSKEHALTGLYMADPEVVAKLTEFSWMQQQASLTYREVSALYDLLNLTWHSTEIGGQVIGYPWWEDGLTDHEINAMPRLVDIARRSPETIRQVVEYPWLSDGITDSEVWSLDDLSQIAREDKVLIQQVAQLSWVRSLPSKSAVSALSRIGSVAEESPEDLELLPDILTSFEGDEQLERIIAWGRTALDGI